MKKLNFLLLIALIAVISCSRSEYSHLEDGLYADIKTDKGSMILKLEYEHVPNTVANFVSLAEGTNEYVSDSLKGKAYYAGIKFHRVIADFMIQGGDPSGTGSGSPGYRFEDEFPRDTADQLILKHDKAGILSMANAGPGTNGSQFFITHKATPHLDGKHSVFGSIVEGQNVVDSIQQNDLINEVVIIRNGRAAKRFDAAKVFNSYLANIEAERIAKEARLESVYEEYKALFEEYRAQATTLASGLSYAILESKEGEKPEIGTMVKVNYAGFFTDGKLFDTSYEAIAKQYEVYNPQRAAQNGYSPFEIVYSPEARLIPGFREGMQQLKFGDKGLLFIPSELGYGATGAGEVIPPNSDLIFILEIVK